MEGSRPQDITHSLTHSLTFELMTALTTQVPATELQIIQDDDLVAVQGGGAKMDFFGRYVAKPVVSKLLDKIFG